jgi:ZIP family zinc transporter
MGVAGGGSEKAFGFVVLAGLSTGIGASVVFSDKAIQKTNPRVLASCLGGASGVMLYVSFLDIFSKSLDAYAEVHDESRAYTLATVTFFCGFILYALIDFIVHLVDPHGHSHDIDIGEFMGRSAQGCAHSHGHNHSHSSLHGIELTAIEMMAFDSALEGGTVTLPAAEAECALPAAEVYSDVKIMQTDVEKKKLAKMGLMTALAISIHNFPEGLLTYVGYISDPAVGISLAAAIGIHNIPEGLCVAIPVYYATGSRCKAFGWAMISGFSEILGGGLGWAVLANTVDSNVYGALFGVVGGMMVMICISELIPTAVRYDPEDKVTTKSIIGGMIVMAVSLILLNQ